MAPRGPRRTLENDVNMRVVAVITGLLATGRYDLQAAFDMALVMLGSQVVDLPTTTVTTGPRALRCPKCNAVWSFAPGSVCPDCKVKLVKAE
jgi:hypothetical protein